jgi:DNA polymerase III alpha subunit
MIQLKIKTEYSFGQTYAPIKNVIARLKEIGCTHAGIVDGDTWGHIPFYKACKAAGIQPMLGIEITVSDDDIPQKMWFLAKNKPGLNELYKAISKAYGQKISLRTGKIPRIYKHQVIGMSDNIFKFAGDITDGEFLQKVGAIIDLSPASRILNNQKKKIAAKYKLAVVDVSDNAFCKPEDADVFQLISKSGKKMTPQYVLDELDNQDVAENIAQDCEGLEISIAPMIRAEGDLERLCRDGIKYRKMDGIWTDEYEERLNYEIGLIRSKDFDSYFIVVADMVHYAKNNNVLVGPSRGSAAGSLVCYLTRITEIDPIPPKLYFERFIDVSRSDLPDIDLDFPDNKRHIIFEYMAEKYGSNNVAHIGTISKFKPKSTLITVCKALNIPASSTAAVKVAMIERSSADERVTNCLEDTFTTTKPGQDFIKNYPAAKLSQVIEGHASHTGVHAAGLLICNEEITNYCVVDDLGIAHIEKTAAEWLGLLKIDVLGLRTLAILEDSDVGINWYDLKFDDEKTYQLMNNHRYCGIFQFEGESVRSVAESIKFETLNEFDAVSALARPGPFGGGITQKYIERKNGKTFSSMHPLVEEYMADTYGLPVYQEQTLAIVKNIGLFNWEETTAIRKAMSKSMGNEYFEKHRVKFIAGATSQGMAEVEADAIWRMINGMGSWAMNKAHTYSYAVISYWCAYLKANHLLEFAAANLRNAKDEESALLLLRELHKEGVEHIAFDIKLSKINWGVSDGKLVGGFTALKGIGEKKAEKLMADRDANRLTKKQLETIEKCERIYGDIFPFDSLYKHIYDNPEANGIVGKVWKIGDIKEGIPHGEERVVIGELVHKNPRNANEENEIKKRDGKIETGQLEYLDIRLRDDTGIIGGRIGRKDYFRIGIDIVENVPVGSHLMVRARFWNGIRYLFITKYKVLK